MAETENLISSYSSKLLEGKEGLKDFYGKGKENNNVEGIAVTENSTIDGSERNVRKNFFEKPETKDEKLEFFGDGFFHIYIEKRIDALELYKKCDNYYFESFLEQYQKQENQIIYQPKSRNFIPKSEVVDPNDDRLNKIPNKLYYNQKVSNIIFSTYVDRNYSLIKAFNHLPSNQNKTTNAN